MLRNKLKLVKFFFSILEIIFYFIGNMFVYLICVIWFITSQFKTNHSPVGSNEKFEPLKEQVKKLEKRVQVLESKQSDLFYFLGHPDMDTTMRFDLKQNFYKQALEDATIRNSLEDALNMENPKQDE